ncbi:MAG: hypothetical protein L3K00_06200 [Thermoplasmata archaeon]|nr:hypothetical protein [Thermoplasmata archaeon]MCI4361704.1 hypothetical protein [Thermoplasmata archaeon]
MTSPSVPETAEEALLAKLHRDLSEAPGRVKEIEAGISLSIALGRRRPAVACGGCQTPLEFEGVPARTNAALRVPYRLVLDASAPG